MYLCLAFSVCTGLLTALFWNFLRTAMKTWSQRADESRAACRRQRAARGIHQRPDAVLMTVTGFLVMDWRASVFLSAGPGGR